MQPASGNDPRGALYAGQQTCIQCHQQVNDSYIHSSHFNASSPVSAGSLQKALGNTNTAIAFHNGQSVKAEEKNGVFVQSLYDNGNAVSSEKMDVAFGSGEKAQTFGYWKNNQLFQLPLTYLSGLHLWTNSPGFPVDQPYFTRPVISRCFECHSSFVRHFNEQTGPMEVMEKFDANTIVYGIDCERCHGPAKQHADFHLQNPNEKKAAFITSISLLNRTQQSDLCGSCHSGNPAVLKSIFAFVPGDALRNYYMYYPGSFVNPDMHGMQMQLLQQSKCYQQSQLTCISCHSSHATAGNAATSFLNTCMSCHQQSAHSKQMISENGNCISCHMPLRASKSLDFNNGEKKGAIPYKLRTHRIAIYPEAEWQ
ncbi:MAG: multiheme c-type cytochrome [Flavihumibacter sp.]